MNRKFRLQVPHRFAPEFSSWIFLELLSSSFLQPSILFLYTRVCVYVGTDICVSLLILHFMAFSQVPAIEALRL